LGWRLGDWFSKRVTGWINTHYGGRAHRFRQAADVLAVLAGELRQRRPDCVVFSGDATMLGLASEVNRTAAVLQVGSPGMPAGFAVPGNHDYYTPGAAASGAFEKSFAAWQEGERLDGAVYPFARRIGSVWLIGINSSTGNRWPWDATGRVSADQLERLSRLLAGLAPGPRILVTHYPVSDERGRPERPWHLLRNLSELLDLAQRVGIGLWLHGHRHHPYRLDDPGVAPFPIICVGSATEAGIWGYNEYTLDGLHLHGTHRRFDPAQQRFQDAEAFELTLRPNPSAVAGGTPGN
jgi:3',5'-cyclic AMP phosphodiesterase CpdA